MKLACKIMIGAAAIGVASAASFPGELGALYRGSYPNDWQKRQALEMCERTNSTFIRFLPSEREACYSRMRDATSLGETSGIWSRHDRSSLPAEPAGSG